MSLLCGDTQSLDIHEDRFQSCCSSAPLLQPNTKSMGEMLHHLIQLICLPTIPPFTDYHYYMKEYDDLHSTSTYSPNRPFILLPPGSYTVPQQFFFLEINLFCCKQYTNLFNSNPIHYEGFVLKDQYLHPCPHLVNYTRNLSSHTVIHIQQIFSTFLIYDDHVDDYSYIRRYSSS